ncbi:MAG: glycoside hydrolase family 3 protein [Proteobacteria bacterium]|nr:glycoside hydrolase family 3 protein [Pseudomonadota bacterium]
MGARAVIFGLAGPELLAGERAFFADSAPWGFVLFARNVECPAQLSRLTADLRDAAGRDVPVLIDQEGGRVARLGPPHWRRWQPVLRLFAKTDGSADEAAALEATRLRYRIIAGELAAMGIDVNCVPLLDVPAPGAHDVIGERALGRSAEAVARRGRAVCEGLRAGGVLPVIKHLPGHGRADLDSHHAAPRVASSRETLDSVDFAAFRPLAGEALGMTAHVVFEAIDRSNCATLSPAVIAAIRREIGFDGLLMTDDVSMKALPGALAERVDGALAAGCDLILHCNGDLAEMREIAAHAPLLAGLAAGRAARAEAERGAINRGAAEAIDIAAAEARYAELTGERLHA